MVDFLTSVAPIEPKGSPLGFHTLPPCLPICNLHGQSPSSSCILSRHRVRIYMPLLYMHLKKPKQLIIWNGWSSTYPRFDYHSHPKANTRSYACLLSCNKSNLLKPLAFKTQRDPSFNYHPKAKCISKSFQNPLLILIFSARLKKSL